MFGLNVGIEAMLGLVGSPMVTSAGSAQSRDATVSDLKSEWFTELAVCENNEVRVSPVSVFTSQHSTVFSILNIYNATKVNETWKMKGNDI